MDQHTVLYDIVVATALGLNIFQAIALMILLSRKRG